jgi:transposase
MRRTAVINQTRSLLLERGITLRRGRCHLETALPGIIEDATASLSSPLRILLTQMKLGLDPLVMRIQEADAGIKQATQENEHCRRPVTNRVLVRVTATALIAAIGNGARLRKRRDFAAWIGVVPREYSTGGKQKLLGISKRGKRSYVRRPIVLAATRILAWLCV